MRLRLVFIVIILFFAASVYPQKRSNPRNLEKAVEILLKETPDSIAELVKSTTDDSLFALCYPTGKHFKNIYSWIGFDRKKARLKRYFKRKDIDYYDYRSSVVLIAYKHTLLNGSFDEGKILKPYQEKQTWKDYQHENRFTLDTLYGVYIPYDLEDCFRVLDEIFNDSIQDELKIMRENDFAVRAHFGLGMWMRNNWQLWGGSRLSVYFQELGVIHPDNISGIILISYHRHICGKEIKLEEQIKDYKTE
ncbi:MAG: hypothetical protein C0592_00905 [Marinilabiliales bacterium]|nr:MAG: hypothetical protein C0592_00905 [Marinilabiliales bacterium]